MSTTVSTMSIVNENWYENKTTDQLLGYDLSQFPNVYFYIHLIHSIMIKLDHHDHINNSHKQLYNMSFHISGFDLTDKKES